MAIGFSIKNCKDLTFTSPSVRGAEVGFYIEDSEDIKVISAKLHTRTGIKGTRVKGLSMTDSTHDDHGWKNQPTCLAVFIRRAIYGDV